MSHEVLDSVVLVHDIEEHGLRAGDLGTILRMVHPDGLEVEFVTASGRTTALVSLNASDVRSIADTDLVAVRTVECAGDRSAP
jgi:hypothetical protein